MFGNSQLKKQIATLQARVRDLEGLVDELAARAGVGDVELAELRADVGPRIPEESRRLVAEGRVIEAIKVYREHSGVGLREAKDAIDAYRAG
jgi:large subunit ribosomal protein L7/L12